eukprot:SAG11_NODE_3223_length_2601_cov_2.196643_1_plen_119_part_00
MNENEDKAPTTACTGDASQKQTVSGAGRRGGAKISAGHSAKRTKEKKKEKKKKEGEEEDEGEDEGEDEEEYVVEKILGRRVRGKVGESPESAPPCIFLLSCRILCPSPAFRNARGRLA